MRVLVLWAAVALLKAGYWLVFHAMTDDELLAFDARWHELAAGEPR